MPPPIVADPAEIAVGSRLPEATFFVSSADGKVRVRAGARSDPPVAHVSAQAGRSNQITTTSVADVFGGKRVALFAVPGMFGVLNSLAR